MRSWLRAACWACLLALLCASRAAAQTIPPTRKPPTPTPAPAVAFLNPQAGQALQGKAAILAKVAVSDGIEFSLFFGYTKENANFLIAEGPLPEGEMLAEWDTTTITDGSYVLRLVIRRENGDPLERLVEGVRVRNTSPIETDTPTPAPFIESAAATGTQKTSPGTPTASATPSATVSPAPPTLTPWATNPAELTLDAAIRSSAWGVLSVIGLFAFLGFYASIRKILQK